MKKTFLKITALAILLLIVAIGCKKDISVIGVTLNETGLTLVVGETATLTATVFPNDATDKAVSWTSDNTTVATVANGIVTAKEAGTATITVATEDGNYTATCAVTVIPEWVLINGVKWATRNVDMPGTFAATPQDAGMFYQRNRKIGWSSTDPMINSDGGTTWDDSYPEGDTWEKENDPCPTGWRVPTAGELWSLVTTGSEWTTENDVNGRTFGNDDNLLFLPAARFRNYLGELRGIVGGYYWSSVAESNYSYVLSFTSTGVSPTNGNHYSAAGFSVR